jgi:hypothetical protein
MLLISYSFRIHSQQTLVKLIGHRLAIRRAPRQSRPVRGKMEGWKDGRMEGWGDLRWLMLF